MTSLRFELDSLARRLSWPARMVAVAARALDDAVRRPAWRRAAKAAVDFACAAGAVAAAVALDAGFSRYDLQETATLALLVGLLLVLADTLVGSYRTIWRYTSLPEARALGFASIFVLVALLSLRATGVVDLSLSTLVLIVMFTLLLCVGVRGLRRWSRAEASRGVWQIAAPRRVMIAGAGRHGLSIARELTAGGVPGVELVGFLDDDPAKQDSVLNGVPVLGRLQEALALAEHRAVSEVIVAMPDAKREVVRAFGRRLEDVGIRVRAVGGIARFVQGRDVHRPGRVTLDELLAGMPPSPTPAAPPGDSRRVLVTGGAGFIGSHLTRMLLARGYAVRVLDRFDYGQAGLNGLTHPRLEVLYGDVCSSRDVSRALRDVHGVIALAAIVGDPACNLDPEETINLNYTATKVLVEACNFSGVHRVVFASSCSVYGASNQDVLTEQARLNPVSLYARTRVLSENILFDRAGDVEPVVLRLSTVFGLSPRMRFDLVVNTLTVRAVVDGKISIMGGNQWRPNVHCRDAARAFIRVLEAPAGLVAGEVFNVGGDALNHTIAQLGDMVAEIVGNVHVAQQQDVADPRDYRVCFEKIRNTLGFEPEFTVAAGIREVAAAVRADPALREYQNAVYHNVQALKQTFVTPRRRRTDWFPGAASAPASSTRAAASV
jgi:nucleoside-diphosphate-sugar epimerase